MTGNSGIRASDADRDKAAAALRENLAAGRLTADEFDERLDKAFAAKTVGDLEGLMADLPGTELGKRADAPLGRTEGNPPYRRGRFYPARRTAWGPLLAIGVLVLVIWLFSGAHGSLSFLWVAAALAVLIVARRITGGRARSERKSARSPRSHRQRDRDEAGP